MNLNAHCAVFGRLDTVVIASSAGPWVSLKRYAAVLSLKSGDQDLGFAARKALELHLRSVGELPADQDVSEKEWNVHFAELFGLKHLSTVNAKMKRFTIRRDGINFQLTPTIKRRGPLYSPFRQGFDKGHEPLVLPMNCSDADFGGAIRTALSRCL